MGRELYFLKISEVMNKKGAGHVGSMVEHFPSICEMWGSILWGTKTNKYNKNI